MWKSKGYEGYRKPILCRNSGKFPIPTYINMWPDYTKDSASDVIVYVHTLHDQCHRL